MNKKAQASIVGFSLITLILLTTVSFSFIWGRNLIEKSSNVNDLARVENQLVKLHTAIKEVANERTQRTVNFDIVDGWLLVPDNNSIRYESFGDLPEAFRFNDVRLIVGNTSSFGPCLNSSVDIGRLGFDDPGCLKQTRGGIYELDYIILNDTIENECFGILLDISGNVGATKGEHKVLLTFNDTREVSTSVCPTVIFSTVKINID